MGLIDFMKNAGAKLFGDDEPSAEEKAADRQAKELKAGEALERLVRKMNIQVDDLDVQFSAGVATISGKTNDQASAERAALTVGNISGVSRVDNRIQVLNPTPEAVYYTVQSGDSLSKIAKVQYSDAMKYPLIFEANKPMLSDPDKIYPGQVLRIPPL
jgi:nucleoid-associated protein YgaU